MAYSLRQTAKKNYRVLADSRLPRAERVKLNPERLYSVEVVEREAGRVKVHYCGYSSTFDEWRDDDDVVSVNGEEQAQQVEPYHPFELHKYVYYLCIICK